MLYAAFSLSGKTDQEYNKLFVPINVEPFVLVDIEDCPQRILIIHSHDNL